MSLRTTLLGLAAVVILAGCRTETPETAPSAGNTADSPQTSNTAPQTSNTAPRTSNPAPRTSNLTPSETVVTMMQAYLDKRLGEYYSYVAAVDREAKSLDSLQAEFAPTNADFAIDFLFDNTEFEVDSVEVLGDSAIVYMTSTAPPVAFVMQQAQIIERDLGPETDTQTKFDVLGERHRLSGGPQEENHGAYLLVREETGWKVVVGWADMAEALQGAGDPLGGT